jgi:crossover junction endodeoxyribonuclease RuvC
MRKNPTQAEAVLWTKLRSRRFYGLKFRQQAVFFGFVVDFYCPARLLIVEVDGSWHDDRKAYDDQRTKRIEEAGFKVIRFDNEDVLENIQEVLAEIRRVAQEQLRSMPLRKNRARCSRHEPRSALMGLHGDARLPDDYGDNAPSCFD